MPNSTTKQAQNINSNWRQNVVWPTWWVIHTKDEMTWPANQTASLPALKSGVQIQIGTPFCSVKTVCDQIANRFHTACCVITPKLTFSWCIAHYGTTEKFSLPAASATGGWQALHHSWTRSTPVCGNNAKNSTAGLLIVKWIQLLLVFSWGLNHHREW